MENNAYINREPKTLARWEELLLPSEFEALTDYGYTSDLNILTPDEVLDIIIDWKGGIATAYHIKSIISRVYGVEL